MLIVKPCRQIHEMTRYIEKICIHIFQIRISFVKMMTRCAVGGRNVLLFLRNTNDVFDLCNRCNAVITESLINGRTEITSFNNNNNLLRRYNGNSNRVKSSQIDVVFVCKRFARRFGVCCVTGSE